jgi:hypothetical protein
MQPLFLPSERKMENLNSPLLSDDEIWDELLNSEESKKFLDEQIKEAEMLLNQQLIINQFR